MHAAAGGVGLVVMQWAKHLGVTIIIGTVGSPEKAEQRRKNGCDHVIEYRKQEFAARVKEIANGEGCHVVCDGVGKPPFPASLDCLRRFGTFVSFGSASGPIGAFDIMLLAASVRTHLLESSQRVGGNDWRNSSFAFGYPH